MLFIINHKFNMNFVMHADYMRTKKPLGGEVFRKILFGKQINLCYRSKKSLPSTKE